MQHRKKILLIMKHDITLYPPVISLCNILVMLGYEVLYIGACSSMHVKQSLQSLGVKLYIQDQYHGNALKRFTQQLTFRKRVKKIIEKEYSKKTYLWFIHFETVLLFIKSFDTHRCIAHLLEFRDADLNIGYKLLTGFCDYKAKLAKAQKIICCEYNRAHITQALFRLKELPVVLPNKPFQIQSGEESEEVPAIVTTLKEQYKNKKIILYQGAFQPERQLDKFFEAIAKLPDEYVFFLMGSSNDYQKHLKEKYENPRNIFVPFLTPPLHLHITEMAHIGILAYNSLGKNIGQMINVLYCAPNKIYEYSKFGIPMIANDLPALKFAFTENKAGITLPDPLTAQSIISAIKIIDSDYSKYKEESKRLYNNINMVQIVENIIES